MTLAIHGAPAARPGAPRPPRAGRLLGPVVLGTVLLTGVLAGCAAAPELESGAARQLQSQVLTVTEAAAAKDPAAALAQLDRLVLTLDEAAGRGEVSLQRHQSIRTSIDAVRADLNAQQAEAVRAAAEQEAAARAAEAAAAAAAASAPPPVIAPAPPADNGKAKGKDKGKG